MKAVFFRAPEPFVMTWRKRALDEGLSFQAWITKQLDAACEEEEPAKKKPKKKAVKAPVTVCDKRLPIGTWCKSCGKTH